jgi:hypothetical protein
LEVIHLNCLMELESLTNPHEKFSIFVELPIGAVVGGVDTDCVDLFN